MTGLQYLRNQVVANTVRTALSTRLDALGVPSPATVRLPNIHPGFKPKRTRGGRSA